MKPTYEELEQQLAAVVAENTGLKGFGKTLSEMHEGLNGSGTGIQGEYEATCQQVALDAAMDAFDEIKTPETDAYLAEVRASAISEYADKRGFSFQHGSIHAHFGNGDVLVGATKFETGHAGICFAPVRDKTGGSGTEYAWTEGKNTEEVGAVFVISSSSVEGLEVIQGKIAESIAQLRQGAAL
ncbi:hypothetical protein [Kluyvera intermedia]|uniref:hypothetical protein n=1 Tax=Kluyvera intermedia TaxID=61648 RepID=UPI0039F5DE3D